MNLMGKPVVVTPFIEPVPVLQLSDDFTACSENFRASINEWLLELFETKEVAFVMDGKIFMSPETFSKLKKQLTSNKVF